MTPNYRISFGGTHPARVAREQSLTWAELCKLFGKEPPKNADKASQGWYCGATFRPKYRDSEHFEQRSILTFDYDKIDPLDLDFILDEFKSFEYLAYTTFSHTVDAPRIRILVPCSRPLTYDEFQAVSRKVAARYDINKMARESHVPAQMMFMPCHKPGSKASYQTWRNDAAILDVDAVLAEYADWTDRKSWPHRDDNDGVHMEGINEPPREKQGIIGDFCRAYSIEEAIKAFDLPYEASTEGRYTYTQGSRPDGCIVYDDGQKLHSHHDTDPASGQNNAFDLVRIHHYGWLDTPNDRETLAVTQLPSFQSMVAMAMELPAIRTQRGQEAFEDLDEAAAAEAWLALPGEAPASPAPVADRGIGKALFATTDYANASRLQRHYRNTIMSSSGCFWFWTGTHWRMAVNEVNRDVLKLSRFVRAEYDKLTASILEYAATQSYDPEDVKRALENPKTNVFTKLVGTDTLLEKIAQADKLLKWSAKCESKSTMDAAKETLRTTTNVPAEELDRDPMVLNCLNGTLDLRSATLHPHNPLDRITKVVPVNYRADAQAPRFHEFLTEIFEGNHALIGFIKRWFGYCATGSIDEQKLLIHIGPGGNGKGTLIEALSHILGEYVSAAPPGLILASHGNSQNTELADLQGRRMVTVSEINENAALNESVVKQATGGDRIRARRLYKDFFEFYPTHKLQILTNPEPQIKGQDFAIWRRMMMVRYHVKFGTEADVQAGRADRVRDITLGAALRAEAEGILRWLVEGAQEWAARGLEAPQEVLAEVESFRATQDRIAQFVADCCTPTEFVFTPVRNHPSQQGLYPAYSGWCRESGYNAMSVQRFVAEFKRVTPYAQFVESLDALPDGRERRVAGFENVALMNEALPD